MKTEFTARAAKDFRGLTPALKVLVNKQINMLRDNLMHPSLNAKKFADTEAV